MTVAGLEHVLLPGESLTAGQTLASPNGQFTLTTTNGLVERDWNGLAIWPANATGGTLVMQPDGNLVQYGADSRVLWAANTEGHPGAQAVLQDDGNLVLYPETGRALWGNNAVSDRLVTSPGAAAATLTSQILTTTNRNARFAAQVDGNVVLSSANRPWATGTAGNPGAQLVLQHDGNLVLYSTAGVALWATGTATGVPGVRTLQVHSNGTAVLQHGDQPVWSVAGAPW